jgi:hypothetical protein
MQQRLTNARDQLAAAVGQLQARELELTAATQKLREVQEAGEARDREREREREAHFHRGRDLGLEEGRRAVATLAEGHELRETECHELRREVATLAGKLKDLESVIEELQHRAAVEHAELEEWQHRAAAAHAELEIWTREGSVLRLHVAALEDQLQNERQAQRGAPATAQPPPTVGQLQNETQAQRSAASASTGGSTGEWAGNELLTSPIRTSARDPRTAIRPHELLSSPIQTSAKEVAVSAEKGHYNRFLLTL